MQTGKKTRMNEKGMKNEKKEKIKAKYRIFYNRGMKICGKINATARHNARLWLKKICARQRFKRKIKLILQLKEKKNET